MITKEDLVGVWKSDSSKEYGEVLMEFTSESNLIYTVSENGKKQIINLIYWTENNYLYTDQPSSPQIEKTVAEVREGKLILNYNGVITSFSRV